MKNTQKITPFLWYDGKAEEAASFYISIFKNSKITDISRYPDPAPGGAQPGSVMTVSFELDGQAFIALNGGPIFKFTEAVSFMIMCADQAEVDHYSSKLSSGGGEELECGWVKDKYGLAWQITPSMWAERMASGDKAAKDRMLQALWTMKRLDIAALERAFKGN